jgi:hypothetical protein
VSNAFVDLNPREQRHRFADNMPVRQSTPLRIFERESFFFSAQLRLPIELIENSMRPVLQRRFAVQACVDLVRFPFLQYPETAAPESFSMCRR